MFGMKYSKLELQELAKAWAVLSVAFAWVLSGDFVISLIASMVAVGTGFLFHELAHKYVAQRYQLWAEFRAYDQGLLIALVVAFIFGGIFAAPGAVMIHGPYITREQNGKISAAGPLMNFILAIIFLALTLSTSGMLQMIFNIGLTINVWLGLFNLLPFWVFDGKKIWDWNKPIWAGMLGTGILLMVLGNLPAVL